MLGLLIICGLAAGILSSFFGVGGGIIIVPTLYFLFPSFPPTMVIGTSLGVIFINALLNTYLFKKKGIIAKPNIIISMGVGMALGSYLGHWAASSTPPQLIKIFLATVLISVSFRLFFKKNKKVKPREIKPVKSRWLALTGVAGGVVSGSTGLGGGAILTPILIEVIRIPLKKLPAYTNLTMAIAALVGIARSMTLSIEGLALPYPQFAIGQIHFLVIAIIFIGSFLGAKIGIYFNQRVPQRKAELLFATLLLIISSKIFYSAI